MNSSPELLVYQALQAAIDSNPDVVKKAEEKLSEWELQKGFFPTVVQIFQNQQVDVNVRWMAAVYFKNGVNKYWRKNIKNELSVEEKNQIRSCLLANFSEPIPQVALQIAVLIAKIARIDCPRDWPELIPELLKHVQTTDQLQQQRVLLILHHVVKALSSKRMLADKKLFEELTVNIYDYIYDLWDGFTNLYFMNLGENSPQDISIATMEKALLTLRILRKLTIFGINKPHTSERCMIFIDMTFCRLKQCLECRYELKRLNANEKLIELTEKFILKQLKTLNEFLEMHPISFIKFISTALQFAFNYVFHEGANLIFTGNVINFNHFAIRCINLMKGILYSCNTTSLTSSLTQALDATGTNIEKPPPLRDFFTSERLSYICEKIITHYLVLTQAELDLWIDNPESFAQDDGGECWKYALRPAVETFFHSISNQFRYDVVNEVVKYVTKAQQITLTPSSELKDILLKDAIYNATGLIPFQIFSDVDFDGWFSNQLLAEIKIDADNFRILRRRIIWLIAQWTPVKFSRSLRPLAYEACLHLLRPGEDMSVRLAAANALSALIVDFDFEPEAFLKYLEMCFSSLFVLLGEAEECETKMTVLTIMSLIVENMSDHIEPQADNLIAYLPLLWKESEDYNMLRCLIICTLQQLVKAIRDTPETMKSFLYSVIELSTDIGQPSHVYLMEEGLALWLVVIENTTAITPKLIDICQNLLPIIKMSSENLRTILFLIQAYILLAPQMYLERYGKEFVELCIQMFDDIRPQGIVLILKVFETCLKVDPSYGLDIIKPALPYIFKQVYLNNDFPMTMSMYLTMIARVLIINQNTFTEALQGINVSNALETVLDVWINNMPLVNELDKRKLLSLALASIFTVNNATILDRFPGMMQNISDTLSSVMRENEDENDDDTNTNATNNKQSTTKAKQSTTATATATANGPNGTPTTTTSYYDTLVFQDESDLDSSSYCAMDDFEYKTYHYDRCRQLALKDPVHKIDLKEYIEYQLNTLRTQLGEQSYNNLMENVYSGVLVKMNEYMTLGICFPLVYNN